MQTDATDRIVAFLEKPSDPPIMPDNPDTVLASMGIYVFATKFLFDELRRDAADPNSSRDFGKDLIPYLVKHGKAIAHRFQQSCVRSDFEAEAYWRDAGTLDAYWKANIDLTDVIPALDLYDSDWPIWTYAEVTPPAKFVHDHDGRRGQAISSLISGGCIVSGSSLRNSLLFTGVHAHSYSQCREQRRAARCRHRPVREIEKRHRRSRRADSCGPRGGRGSRCWMQQRFRRTDLGICLITQPMLDRLRHEADRRSIGRLRDISADQDRWPCRRRGSAAGSARRRGCGRALAGAGLSFGTRRARERRRCRQPGRSVRRRSARGCGEGS